MADQPVTSLLISKHSIEKLQSNGYIYFDKSADLSWAKDVSDEIEKFEDNFEMESAIDIWNKELHSDRISTYVKSLDEVLNGGISPGSITEIIGLPGSGKTQLCMQLCASVVFPTLLITGNEEGGEAIYIDTAANFTASRFQEMLTAIMNESKIKYENNDERLRDISTRLKKIHYVEALGSAKFCAAIHQLNSVIKSNTKLRLIVIDTISFPFKDGTCDEIERTGVLYRVMATLRQMTVENNISVIVCNEMSSRVLMDEAVGSLGDSWAHCISSKILLSSQHAVVSTSCIPPQAISIEITAEGMRDTC